MNNPIDYSKYKISSTCEFDKLWLELKSSSSEKDKLIVNKVYQIISDLLSGVDVEHEYGAYHPRNDTDVWDIHIEAHGRTTGDLILLYRINNMTIELDLRLHNITNHKDLYKKSDSKYADRQRLDEFNVVTDKYSPIQIQYGKECYTQLLKDYRLFQLNGKDRKEFTNNFLQNYFDNYPCEEKLSFEELLEIIYYVESYRQKKIFGSINFDSDHKETGRITKRETADILDVFDSLHIEIIHAYIDVVIDDYGDRYEDLYVVAQIDTDYELYTLEESLSDLSDTTEIQFKSKPNGYGDFGQTFNFYHYFID